MLSSFNELSRFLIIKAALQVILYVSYILITNLVPINILNNLAENVSGAILCFLNKLVKIN